MYQFILQFNYVNIPITDFKNNDKNNKKTLLELSEDDIMYIVKNEKDTV